MVDDFNAEAQRMFLHTFYMFYTAKILHKNLCASETLCLCAKNSSLLVNRIK